jgi:uroporphyrinogen decarboxylase
MNEMTTRERMTRMFEHRDADRVPVTDVPWSATVERWHREGMPSGQTVEDFFGLDKFAAIGADNSPRYPATVVEETPEFVTRTTAWGQTVRNWKSHGGVPEFLDCKICSPDAWREARRRMTPDRDRINWDHLAQNYSRWRQEGRWIKAEFWFGFDITHSWITGTETLLMAMMSEPEWVVEMFRHQLDLDLALFDMVWDAGYTFDAIRWPDDMGYKHSQFFSVATYREILKPFHRRAIEWAHSKGIKAELHSCGDIRPLVPELLEIGLDSLNPLEVKAGMDPIAMKAQFGDRIVLHGGLNALLYQDPEQLWNEMRRIIPIMKQNGGYVISSDHSVPDSVSLEQFREFVRIAKELGHP